MTNSYTPGGGVDPAMLTQLLQYLIMQGGQGGSLNNLLPQGSLGGLSFGFDPTSMQGTSIPMIPGSEDEGDRGYVEEASRQANYAQDVGQLAGLGDAGYPALFGPGSYSADAFAPTITNELIQQPATLQFQRYLDPVNAGTFEGRVAQVIQGGGTVTDAVAQMRQVIEYADAHPDDAQAKADADALRPYLPTTQLYDQLNPTTPIQAVDWQQATRQAQDLVEPYLAEQSIQLGPTGATYDPESGRSTPGGEIVEIDGQLYRQTSEPSPMAEAYREAGIPLPTEQYSPADILGPSWAEADATYSSALPGIQDQLAQYLFDATQADARATTLGQLSPDLFGSDGSMVGVSGPVGYTPKPPNAVGEIGEGIVNNAADKASQAIAFTALGALLKGADATGDAINWGSSTIRDAIDRMTGVTPEQLGENTDPGAPVPRTVDEGAAAQAGDYGAPMDDGYGDLGFHASILNPALRLGGVQPPGPGDENDYMTYVMTASPGNTLSYEDWLAQQYANGSYGTIGGQPADPGVQGPPMPGPTPLPAVGGGWTPPPDWSWHNGAWFDGQGRLQGYSPDMNSGPNGVTGQTAQPQPAPPTVTPQYQGPLTATPGSMRDIVTQSTSPNLLTDMAQQQAQVGPSQPTVEQMVSILLGDNARGRISDFENQRDRQFALPSPNTSKRTGPEPSEEATRQSLWSLLFPPSPNSSTRTGPEPSEEATRKSMWGQLWPDSGNQGAQLRFGRSSNTSSRTGPEPSETAGRRSSKGSSGGRGFTLQGLEVLGAQNDARNARNRWAALTDQNTLADRAVHGAAYARARGYTDALRQMGITPTQVALANRTGGINAMFGR